MHSRIKSFIDLKLHWRYNYEKTKIIVKEDGLGEDLLEFVGTASIEVGNLPEGVEIQILLGTMAKK